MTAEEIFEKFIQNNLRRYWSSRELSKKDFLELIESGLKEGRKEGLVLALEVTEIGVQELKKVLGAMEIGEAGGNTTRPPFPVVWELLGAKITKEPS